MRKNEEKNKEKKIKQVGGFKHRVGNKKKGGAHDTMLISFTCGHLMLTSQFPDKSKHCFASLPSLNLPTEKTIIPFLTYERMCILAKLVTHCQSRNRFPQRKCWKTQFLISFPFFLYGELFYFLYLLYFVIIHFFFKRKLV